MNARSPDFVCVRNFLSMPRAKTTGVETTPRGGPGSKSYLPRGWRDLDVLATYLTKTKKGNDRITEALTLESLFVELAKETAQSDQADEEHNQNASENSKVSAN